MQDSLSLIDTIRIILKWKKHIAYSVLAAAILSAAGSWFLMDDYYLSWATVYPTNQAASDKSTIFSDQPMKGENGYFGDKYDINRVLTIANSTPVIEYVIAKYNLVTHYDIDTGKRYWRTKVRKEFEENYEAIKTDKEAIEISLLDTDPELASEIVNDIVAKVDELNKIQVTNTKQDQYRTLQEQQLRQNEKVKWYVDTLAKLGEEYNIKVTIGADGNNVVLGSNYRAVETFKALLKAQEGAMRELNNINNIMEQMRVSIESNRSSLFIIEPASPADKKTKPLRSVIVLLSVFATLFVSIITVLLVEQFRSIKQKL